jgi:hypothetical protein
VKGLRIKEWDTGQVAGEGKGVGKISDEGKGFGIRIKNDKIIKITWNIYRHCC